MKSYIGYIRVSTLKQGQEGVSLKVQKDGIEAFAHRKDAVVGLWLKEMITAAKRGRPKFNQAMALLRQGKYDGIILHKLDRGVRNLKDWVDLADLSDDGVEIHFVNESLDLNTRGGRLSADIQAVVSADYIRNLKEESRKGFYGRLKDGLYPLPAPIGYLNHGKGKVKTVDPVRGPLVKKAFEMYSTGRYSLGRLKEALQKLGLKNLRGGPVSKNGFSIMLNNPFYIGIMRIFATGEHFVGIHKRLIPKALFDRVHDVLAGKANARMQRHSFAYRRMLSCSGCHYSLIGERQKGHVYYRCQTQGCPTKTVREESVKAEVADFLHRIEYSDDEKRYLASRLQKLDKDWMREREEALRAAKLRSDQTKDRLNRLTDAYLDQALDKAMFEERKKNLLMEQKSAEANLADLERNTMHNPTKLDKFLELAGNAWLSHEAGNEDEKRDILETVTSNRHLTGKNVYLEPSLPFGKIAERWKNANSAPYRDIPRTWEPILTQLLQLNAEGKLPDLEAIPAFNKKHKRRRKIVQAPKFACTSKVRDMRMGHFKL